jgi:uncharacterized protein YjdB
MKICKNCHREIDEDALVCPYCGCVNKKIKKEKSSIIQKKISNRTVSEPTKKRRTWLWILGWIFIFPVPLTILMLRNKKLNKLAKVFIIVAAWIIFLIFVSSRGSSDTSSANKSTGTSSEQITESAEEITGLSFAKTGDLTVEVGESTSSSCLNVKAKSKKRFNADDFTFVTENPDIATIAFSHNNLTRVYAKVTGVSVGETNIYVTSKDGSVQSESIHVVVSEKEVPVSKSVNSIELQGYKSDLCISQTTAAEVTILPSDAEYETITWASSDESVATVDDEGYVTAVGDGTATISVTTDNDVSASFDVNVDGTKAQMHLSVRHTREDDFHIGDDWSYNIQVNGERAPNEMNVSVGDTLSFYAEFIEDDTKPDKGSAETTHTVTEEDIKNGFEVNMDLYVTENGGRNSGQTAHFIVTYTFSTN